MHDKLKTYFTRYSGTVYIVVAVLIILCGWFIFGGGNDSDYQRSVDDLERAQEQQRKSVELNQTVTDSVERSTQLNQQASERIERIEKYQQQAVTRIEESRSRLDEAEAILERNEQLIRDVEQGYQTEQIDGRATTQTAEHVGTN